METFLRLHEQRFVPSGDGVAAALCFLAFSSAGSAQVPRVDYTFIVVEENQDFSCVIGNPGMKFLNDLATKYGLAASYYANAHPSISNYFMLTAGQAIYKGRMGDFRSDPVDVDNVIRELKSTGKTWRAYVEGVPGPGYTGGNIGNTGYVKRHNPLAYFEKDIPASDRSNLAPFAQFSDDLANQRLANYAGSIAHWLYPTELRHHRHVFADIGSGDFGFDVCERAADFVRHVLLRVPKIEMARPAL